MKREQKQHSIKRFFSSPLFVICTSILACIFIFSYIRSYKKEYDIKKEIKELEYEVQSLEHKKIESLEIREYLLSEYFIEEKARTELQLKKPGEQVVRILNPKEDTNIEGDSLEKTFPLNNPVHWWYYFTHK